MARNAPVTFWFSEPIDPGSLGSTPITVTSKNVRQGGSFHYDPLERSLTYSPRGSYRAHLAYDATLDESIRSLRTGAQVVATPITFITGDEDDVFPDRPPTNFETEVLPLFQNSCAFSSCHAPPALAASIDLSTRAGLEATVIAAPCRSWPGWLLVDPGSAAWSYLVYKVIGEESARGDPMPPGAPLYGSEIQTFLRWIDEGAKVDHSTVEP